MAFFNLTPKVYICIYTYFDINKIYKGKKAGQLLLNLNNKISINQTKWVNEGCDRESYLYWIFCVGPNYFLLEKDILGLAMLI